MLFCVIALALCLWLVLRHKTEKNKVAELHETAIVNRPPQPVKQFQQPTNILQSHPNPKTGLETLAEVRSNLLSPGRMKRLEKIQEAWRTPIEFYGIVVDQSNNPVAGASIQFVCSDLSKTGTSYYNAESDANGMFSLTGVLRKGISVQVSKEGYYASRRDRDSFEYAFNGGNNFVPDAGNPVIFHLHKKGQGAQLTTSAYGMRDDFPVLVPRDGTPVNVDLIERKTDVSGDLQLSQIKPDWSQLQQATNWSFHMNLSDGGFVGEDDAFQFEAPETGYESTIDLNFVKGEPGWETQMATNYYIVFGQPPKYGWLHIDANIAQQTVFLKYAINPTGSRNLEPK